MDNFFQEPWAPILVFAIISNIVWTIMWVGMWSTGRFQKSIGRGIPILLGIGLFNVPFGFLFLIATVVGLIALSVFWLYASVTNTCERERATIANFLRSANVEEQKKGAGSEKGQPTKKSGKKVSSKKS